MSNENENLVQDMEETVEDTVSEAAEEFVEEAEIAEEEIVEEAETCAEEAPKTPAEAPKKKKKLIRRKLKSIKKWPIVLYIVLIAFGVIGCLLSWSPRFTIVGNITSSDVALPCGIITMIAIAIELWGIKCPYCGSRKVGRSIGFKAKIAKSVECPDCHKKIIIK